MRFGLIHRIMTGTLASLGILALVMSGKLHPVATALVLVGLVVGLFLPEHYRRGAYLQVMGVVGPLAALALQGGRLALGGDPIPIVVEFAAALQVLRLVTRRGAAHDHQVILLALLHLIAGTVLGGGLTYAVALAGFLVFTPGALVLSHLRREVEGNYRQGARDRTGMPVDVPRILRSRRVIGKGFLLFTCSLALPVFLFSALLFMLFPRVGFAWLSVPPIAPSRMVGFSDRVNLGGVGTIRTDPTLVMRLIPSDLPELEDPPLRRNFYLRGAVFDTYSSGQWARHEGASFQPVVSGNHVTLRRVARDSDRTILIDLDRIDPPVVFVPGEAVALEVLSGTHRPRQARSIVETDARGQLVYSSFEEKGLTYRVYLPPQGLVFPERERAGNLRRYLMLPEELSDRVEKLAHDLTEGTEDPLEMARRLEKALRTNYTYDLGSPSGGAPDPLDHFLFESKRGHCEFYSTAMAIMLRVRGVPSRNVTGFVGGTYNRFGGFYAVRQGDAHSWVEAYLPERGWIRFDPTPPSSAEPQATAEGFVGMIREIIEAASRSWQQNVEGYDMNKQLGLFSSIKRALSAASPKKASRVTSRLNLRRLGLLVAGAGLLIFGLLLWLRKRREADGVVPQISPSVAKSIDLYRRLERALESRGIARPASTPPLIHARALQAAGHSLGAEAVALTEIYVSVRFGNERLDEKTEREFLRRVDVLRRSVSTSQAA
jgi:protein-glutamine gamma-glutamyltransferase